ncbi:hypothetical protein LXL04_000497 [Taraxacum kok-saghyz]
MKSPPSDVSADRFGGVTYTHHYPLRLSTCPQIWFNINAPKHIEIDLHFVRDKVAMGHIRVLHVPSASQYADIFTKGLPSTLFLDFRSSLNVRSRPPVPTAGDVDNNIGTDEVFNFWKPVEPIDPVVESVEPKMISGLNTKGKAKPHPHPSRYYESTVQVQAQYAENPAVPPMLVVMSSESENIAIWVPTLAWKFPPHTLLCCIKNSDTHLHDSTISPMYPSLSNVFTSPRAIHEVMKRDDL